MICMIVDDFLVVISKTIVTLSCFHSGNYANTDTDN